MDPVLTQYETLEEEVYPPHNNHLGDHHHHLGLHAGHHPIHGRRIAKWIRGGCRSICFWWAILEVSAVCKRLVQILRYCLVERVRNGGIGGGGTENV